MTEEFKTEILKEIPNLYEEEVNVWSILKDDYIYYIEKVKDNIQINSTEELWKDIPKDIYLNKLPQIVAYEILNGTFVRNKDYKKLLNKSTELKILEKNLGD